MVLRINIYTHKFKMTRLVSDGKKCNRNKDLITAIAKLRLVNKRLTAFEVGIVLKKKGSLGIQMMRRVSFAVNLLNSTFINC